MLTRPSHEPESGRRAGGCESEEWREVKEWRKVNIFGGVLKKDMGRQEEERERAANGEFSSS